MEKSAKGELRDCKRKFSQCLGCNQQQAFCQLAMIRDAVVINHAPIGCAGEFADFNFTYRVEQARRDLPPALGRYYCTNLLEKDTDGREMFGTETAQRILFPDDFYERITAIVASSGLEKKYAFSYYDRAAGNYGNHDEGYFGWGGMTTADNEPDSDTQKVSLHLEYESGHRVSIDTRKPSEIEAMRPFLDELTAYLWPIVREMVKTAVENNQNLIVEGCYIPFDWRKDFETHYLKHIRFICLAMTCEYIETHYDDITKHASEIESRIMDEDCAIDSLREDNRSIIEGFQHAGESVILIDDNYEETIQLLLD